MKNKFIKYGVCSVLVYIWSLPVFAFSYDEAFDGDIDGNQFNLFNLENGSNTISGSMMLEAGGGNAVDFDNFMFSLQGGVLESITYDYMTTEVNGLTSAGYNPALYSLSSSLIELDLLGFAGGIGGFPVASGSGTGISIFADELQSVRGTVDNFAWNDTYTYLSSQTGTAFWDYTITFNVSGIPDASSVPEASSLYLLAFGFLGLFAGSRRKV